MIDIGKKIAELRRERNWTQEKLAEKIDMTKQVISHYEKGIRKPSYEALEAIADAFNVDMSTFLTSEEQTRELREHYAREGIAARVSVQRYEEKTALDQIIDNLLEYREGSTISPDEQRLLDAYRLLNAKQKAKMFKLMDAIFDN